MLPVRVPIHHFRMFSVFFFLTFRVFRISPSFICPFHFRNIPSFIFHHFRVIVHLRNIPSCFHLASQSIIAGCPKLSVLYVPVLPEIAVIHISSFPFQFRIIPSSYFRKFPSFIFDHFRFISGLFRRHISANFRPSYLIISASFPDYSVVIFPEISVLHISSFPLHFRTIPSSYFRKFPSFIFHHFRLISGLLRRLISGNFRHSYFIISASFPDYSVVLFPEVSVLHISSCPFHFRIIPSSSRFGRPRHF